MAASDKASDDSLYPIAVLIDELKNEDIQVSEQTGGRARQMGAMIAFGSLTRFHTHTHSQSRTHTHSSFVSKCVARIHTDYNNNDNTHCSYIT